MKISAFSVQIEVKMNLKCNSNLLLHILIQLWLSKKVWKILN